MNCDHVDNMPFDYSSTEQTDSIEGLVANHNLDEDQPRLFLPSKELGYNIIINYNKRKILNGKIMRRDLTETHKLINSQQPNQVIYTSAQILS